MTAKLVALCEIYYGGKTHHDGDAFEASETDAAILVGLKKAWRHETAPARPVPTPQPLQTQALKAEETPPAKPMTTGTLPPAKRRYKRRDMRAED